MKYLTRKEELLLLAVLQLKDNASLVSIRELLIKSTGEDWTVGNVYVALNKMHEIGYLECTTGEPSAKRGGKAIKFYAVAPEGLAALKKSNKVQDFMWQALPFDLSEK